MPHSFRASCTARHTLIAWVVAAVLGAATLYLTFTSK